ncbi:MAG TPA: TetR/AcrR family transcriptional regulator [Candidatus Paceibacterota bacterium]|jgi:AcrR family transcriptional regulator|nr:TetR/AcrR family transcriptional regulator [Candidatus Paceibacterota bacterium]
MNALGETKPISPVSKRKISRERTRQRIIEGTRRLFLKHSYRGVTIRGLAEEIGMSTGAIFANFDGKDALLVAVLEQEHQGYETRLREILQQDKKSREMIADLLAIDYEPDRLALFRHEAARSWDTDPRTRSLLQKRFDSLEWLMQKHFCTTLIGTELFALIWAHHQENCRPTGNIEWNAQALRDHLAKQIATHIESFARALN